jgi:hypothetical protein
MDGMIVCGMQLIQVFFVNEEKESPTGLTDITLMKLHQNIKPRIEAFLIECPVDPTQTIRQHTLCSQVAVYEQFPPLTAVLGVQRERRKSIEDGGTFQMFKGEGCQM